MGEVKKVDRTLDVERIVFRSQVRVLGLRHRANGLSRVSCTSQEIIGPLGAVSGKRCLTLRHHVHVDRIDF